MTHFKIIFIFLFAGILLGFSFGMSHALPTTPSDYDWVHSAYWSLTDRTTATNGVASFAPTMERAAYESDVGFYFQVRDTGHTDYSDHRGNSSAAVRTHDHGPTAFNGNGSAFIYLEDLPGLGDRDFQDMVIEGIDLAPASAPAPVPEPATMVLLGVGLLGIAGIHRSRFNQR